MRSFILAFAVLAAAPALAAEEDAAALWTSVGYAWNAGRLPETAYIGGQSPALANMVVKMLMEHFKGHWNRSHAGNNHGPLRDEVARIHGLTQSLPEAERRNACTLELRGVRGLDNEKYDAVPDDLYAPLAAACPR